MPAIAERNANPTPGPWTVEQDEGGLYIRMEALAGADEYLAIYASPNPGQREADARLIAAAPALLEAAKATLAHLEELEEAWLRGALSEHDGHDGVRSNRNHDMRVRLGRAIVAAAEGRSA